MALWSGSTQPGDDAARQVDAMLRRHCQTSLAARALWLASVGLGIAAPGVAAAEAPLRVALAGSAPFVGEPVAAPGSATVSADPTGIAVDLWAQAARRMGWSSTLRRMANAEAAVQAVAAGEADVAVGPLSATARRAGLVAFTQPFFQAQIGIAAPERAATLADRLEPFVSPAFLGGLAALLLVLVLVGAALWWVERGRSEDFPHRPAHGVGVGVWLALTTMTTVGYGDKAPRTPAGRVITGAWMLISLISVSSLTAFLATAATLAGIERATLETAEELRGHRVAVVRGTTSLDFARRNGARLVELETLDQALDASADGRAEAVVFDRPALRWRLGQRPDLALGLSPHGYEPVGYAFALRLGDPRRDRLDQALLALAEEGITAAMVERWLGPPGR